MAHTEDYRGQMDDAGEMRDRDRQKMAEEELRFLCEHAFQHQGVKWWVHPEPRPGTGALTVLYYDAYFCSRCLESRLVELNAGDRNSYQERLPGSSPVSVKDAEALRKKSGTRYY